MVFTWISKILYCFTGLDLFTLAKIGKIFEFRELTFCTYEQTRYHEINRKTKNLSFNSKVHVSCYDKERNFFSFNDYTEYIRVMQVCLTSSGWVNSSLTTCNEICLYTKRKIIISVIQKTPQKTKQKKTKFWYVYKNKNTQNSKAYVLKR